MWWEVIVGDEVAIISKDTFDYCCFLGEAVLTQSFSFSSPIKRTHKIAYVSPLDSLTDTRFWTWDSEVVHSCEAAILKPGFVLPEISVETLICEIKTPESSVASRSERGAASPRLPPLFPERADDLNSSGVSEPVRGSELDSAPVQTDGLLLRATGTCLSKRGGAVLDAYASIKAYIRVVLNGLFLHEIGSSAVDMENGLYIPSYDALAVCPNESHCSVIVRFVTCMTAEGDTDTELETVGARWIGRPDGNLFRVLRPLIQSHAPAALVEPDMRFGRGHNRIIVSSSALDSPLGSFDENDHAADFGSADSEGMQVFHERPVAAAARSAGASVRGAVEIELHCDCKRERDTLYLALLGLLPRRVGTDLLQLQRSRSSCASAAMTLRQRLRLMPWNAGEQTGSPSRLSRAFSISKSASDDSQPRLSSESRSAELNILPLAEVSARKMRSVSEGEHTLTAALQGDAKTATRSRLGSVFFNRNNTVLSPNSKRQSVSVQDTAAFVAAVPGHGAPKDDNTVREESRDNEPPAPLEQSTAPKQEEIVAYSGLKSDSESVGDMKVSVVAQTDKMAVRSRLGSIFYSGNAAISQPGRQRKSLIVAQPDETNLSSV
jgi:hypothetical protein